MPEAPFPPGCARKFKPLRLLASGGFGHVWEAEQVGLGRRAAVKILSQALGDDAKELDRFTSEARITAALNHPAIVVVLDHDVEDGVPWIAYELLPGASLRAHLEEHGRLAAAEVADIGHQLAAALECVHAAGILHRDIKPDNVLPAGGNRWKLADFGIAKWSAARVKTATGVILGTPAYLAPELITGASAGPAADLYALGILLYELAAGAPPFAGENIMQILQGHTTGAPPPLARTPRALAQVIERLLLKNPDARHASAAELRHELEGLAGQLQSVPAPDEPRRSRVSATTARVDRTRVEPVERSRAPFAVAAVLLLAGAALGARAWQGKRVDPVPSPTATTAARTTARDAAVAVLAEARLHADRRRGDIALRGLVAFARDRAPDEKPPEGLTALAFRELTLRARELWSVAETIDLTLLKVDGLETVRKQGPQLLRTFEELAPLLVDLETDGHYLSDAALYLHDGLRFKSVAMTLAGDSREFARRWVTRYPKNYAGYLFQAAQEAASEERAKELEKRERAFALFRVNLVDTIKVHKFPEVLRAYFRMAGYLQNVGQRLKRRPKQALVAWVEAMTVVAELELPQPPKVVTERIKLAHDVFKRTPGTVPPPERFGGDDLRRQADYGKQLLAHFEKASEDSARAHGLDALEWARYHLAENPPGPVPEPLARAMGLWLTAECEEIRKEMDRVGYDFEEVDELNGVMAVRYTRLVDIIDAIGPLLFRGHVGAPWTHRVMFAFERLLQRQEIEKIAAVDPVVKLLPVWRRRYGEVWTMPLLESALLAREKRRSRIESLRRQGLDLYRKAETGPWSCEGVNEFWGSIGEDVSDASKKRMPALIAEVEADLARTPSTAEWCPAARQKLLESLRFKAR